MTALLAGIDWSTRAIHAALIPLDPDHGDPDVPPVTFRMAELSGRDTVTRCQSVNYAMRDILAIIPSPTKERDGYPYTAVSEVESVWIEEAYGNHRNADRALLPIQGAIIASCRHRSVATLTAVEWRKQLGLPQRMDKAHAIDIAIDWMAHLGSDPPPPGDFSHHADALLLALAAREITWRAAA